MKTIVLGRDVLELEIKPHALLDEYRHLNAEDVRARLIGPNELRDCACPGCCSRESKLAFEKMGLSYLQCERCLSMYVSPRPSEQAVVDFYRNSRGARFWRDWILPETRNVRREKVFRPRARWLLNVVDQYCPQARQAIVVGYHNDLLIEELLRQEGRLFQIIVANPIADLEYAGSKLSGVRLEPTPISDLARLGAADIILAFDIVDRAVDLEALFASARQALKPRGLLLASTMLISGFDLQVLWERSEAIYPPDRMNLLSTEGLTALFDRHGFEVLEFSTPGMFDVEIVQRAMHSDPDGDWPRFIQYLVENRDENALNALQEYLQRYRLSSFARIVLRRGT